MTVKTIKIGSTTHDIQAGSADKLNTNAGSATKPVYFTNGVPTACTYTLGKSVPSNAVFTDTTYSAGTGISLSGTTFSNSGVRSVATGSSNGTISVDTNGNKVNVAVKGLGSAAYTASTAYAASGHTHSYLPLSGGTLTNTLRCQKDTYFEDSLYLDGALMMKDSAIQFKPTYADSQIQFYNTSGTLGSLISTDDNYTTININGLKVTSTSNPVTPNAASYRSYDTNGTQKSLIWLSTANNLIVGNADSSATLAHSGHTYICAPNGNVRLRNSGQELIYSMSDGTGFFRPVTTNKNCLGGSSYRWATIYAKNALNTSSDYYQKRDIESMPQKYINMLDDIDPVVFKFNDGDRVHSGYISQWIEESMEKYDIAAEEFGGFCKDPKLDENENIIEGEYEYSLRYSEFIPILHAKVKQLEAGYNAKLEELNERIIELEELLLNK